MKKNLFSLAVLLLSMQVAVSQTITASIGAGSSPNSINIYLTPSVSQTPATFSTLQFNVAVPASITPLPTLTILNQAFPGVTWIIDAPYLEGGYYNYAIYTGSSGYTLNLTGNTEFSAMELAFTNGPTGLFTNTAHLVCLPDGGGINFTALFYCTGTISSNGQNLFHAHDVNTVFANGDSYRPGPTPQGTFTSYARLTSGIRLQASVLPVSFKKFEVTCNDKGSLLTWSTATEQNSSKFEIQRSSTGTDWSTIDFVMAAGNSNSARSYQYLDLKGGAALYRIRQVDLDGQYKYTDVRRTNCAVGFTDVVLYPVPAHDKLNIVIRSDKLYYANLQVLDVSGKLVRTIATQVNAGNTNITLNVSSLPAGQYILSSTDPTMQIKKNFEIIR